MREYRRAKTRCIFTDKYRFRNCAAASVIAPPDAAPRKPILPLPLPCSFPAFRNFSFLREERPLDAV